MPREVDEDLLPDGAPIFVVEKVDFIDDNSRQVGQLVATQEHVAKNFGGHDSARRIPSDDQISSDQTNIPSSLSPISEFIVRQSTSRYCVDSLSLPAGFDQLLKYESFSSTRRSMQNHIFSFPEKIKGLSLP